MGAVLLLDPSGEALCAGPAFLPSGTRNGVPGGQRPVQVLGRQKNGAAPDGASTLGGGTALTCVCVMGHDVPGWMKLAAVNEGDQRRRQEATIPTYQPGMFLCLQHLVTPTLSRQRAAIICTQQICSNIMKPELGPLGFGSYMRQRERSFIHKALRSKENNYITEITCSRREKYESRVSRLLAASMLLLKIWRPHRKEPVGHQETDSRPNPGWTGRGLLAPHRTPDAAGLTQRMCSRTVC